MKNEQIQSLQGVHIREATSNDKLGVVFLVSKVMQEFGLPVNLLSIEADFETALKLSENNQAKFWVAEHQNIIIGSIAILASSEEMCFLKRFYIIGEYRGLGLGRQLYELAEQFARETSYKAITLEASRRFTQAIAFYLSAGYQLIEEIDNVWEDNIYRKLLHL